MNAQQPLRTSGVLATRLKCGYSGSLPSDVLLSISYVPTRNIQLVFGHSPVPCIAHLNRISSSVPRFLLRNGNSMLLA
jgi:hypothetical protein